MRVVVREVKQASCRCHCVHVPLCLFCAWGHCRVTQPRRPRRKPSQRGDFQCSLLSPGTHRNCGRTADVCHVSAYYPDSQVHQTGQRGPCHCTFSCSSQLLFSKEVRDLNGSLEPPMDVQDPSTLKMTTRMRTPNLHRKYQTEAPTQSPP